MKTIVTTIVLVFLSCLSAQAQPIYIDQLYPSDGETYPISQNQQNLTLWCVAEVWPGYYANELKYEIRLWKLGSPTDTLVHETIKYRQLAGFCAGGYAQGEDIAIANLDDGFYYVHAVIYKRDFGQWNWTLLDGQINYFEIDNP
jgi:hypothetical protein